MAGAAAKSRHGIYYLLAALALAAVVVCYLGVTLAAGQESVMRAGERERTERLLAEKSHAIGERLLASEKGLLDTVSLTDTAALLEGGDIPEAVDVFFEMDKYGKVVFPRPADSTASVSAPDFQSFVPSSDDRIKSAEQAESTGRDYDRAASIYAATAQDPSYPAETRAALALRAAQCLVKAGRPGDEDAGAYFRMAADLAAQSTRGAAADYLAACAALEWALAEEKAGDTQHAGEIAIDLYERLFVNRALSMPSPTAEYLGQQIDSLAQRVVSGDLAARYSAAKQGRERAAAMAAAMAEIEDAVLPLMQYWAIRGGLPRGEIYSVRARHDGKPALIVVRQEWSGENGSRIMGFRAKIEKLDLGPLPPGMTLRDESGPIAGDAAGEEWASVPFDAYVSGWRLTAPEPAGLRDRIARGRWLTISITLICAAALALCAALLARGERMRNSLERAKAEFLSNVSHELCTPASSIRVIAETLGSARDAAKREQYVGMLQSESERLSALLDNLLEFSRGRKTAAQYDIIPGDLAAAARAAAEEFARRHDNEEMRFDCDIPAGAVVAEHDAAALRMALGNILDNAYKYSRPPRRIALAMKAGGQNAGITVSDNGIGIPPGEAEKIFERFYRGADARVRAVAGSGIGLSLVREICRAHGGDVRARSEAGRGSAFTITLPLKQASGREKNT
jgi:signal transduction histidine kinase